MKCTCCVSLKLFDSIFKKLDDMIKSEEVQKETELFISSIHISLEELRIQSLIKYFSQNRRMHNISSYFLKLCVKYILFLRTQDLSSIVDDQVVFNDQNQLKEIVARVFSILHFGLIDKDFFYHFIFQNGCENGLIKETKIALILKLFSFNAIEYILLIPVYSFIQSNYLSNCEFVNYFKAIQNASISNDFSVIFNSFYDYLYDDEGITMERLFTWLSKIDLLDKSLIFTPIPDQTVLQGVIERLFIFVSVHSNNHMDRSYSLSKNEFSEFAEIIFKFINQTLSEELFDIAYKRQDHFFEGKVSKSQIIDILNDLSIIYPHIEKESLILSLEEIEVTYFKLLSKVNSSINLSDLACQS